MRTNEVTPEHIVAAARGLQGIAHRTPVNTSRTLNRLTGCDLVLKCENFQRAGAFKFRGAYHALSSLSKQARHKGVIAYSSGNHGQGMALAGSLLQVPITIVSPHNAPRVKLDAIRGYGAELVLYDKQTQQREEVTTKIQKERDLVLVPPFDDPHIIAGQGTAALELLEEHGDLEALLTPCGGGGLLSGCAIALKAHQPRAKIFGVEPSVATKAQQAMAVGKVVRIPPSHSIADGLLPTAIGQHNLAIMRRLVDAIWDVGEEEIILALRVLWERAKLLVEPSAAAALAPLLRSNHALKGAKVGIILSGGNADLASLGGAF